MIHTMKFVAGVPLAAFLHQVGSALEHPAIHFVQLIARQQITRWLEVIEIAQREPKCIANFSICFAELRHHPLAHFHVSLVFH